MRRQNRVGSSRIREMPSIMTKRIGNPEGFNPLGYLVLGTIVGVCGGAIYAYGTQRDAQAQRFAFIGGMAGVAGGATLAMMK